MNRVLFLIPAHESNPCLLDTLKNVAAYNPDIEPYFVLIINSHFGDFDAGLFENHPRLVIGRHLRQFTTYRYESQLEGYVRAFRMGREAFGDLDHVCIFHTSQLFYRTGFLETLRGYDFAHEDDTIQPMPRWYDNVISTGLLKNVVPDHTDRQHYKWRLAENGYWNWEMFSTIVSTIETKIEMTLPEITQTFRGSPVEEIVLATIAWHHHLAHPKRLGPDFMFFVDPSNYVETGRGFTIKSIPRQIDHPVRKLIRDSAPRPY